MIKFNFDISKFLFIGFLLIHSIYAFNFGGKYHIKNRLGNGLYNMYHHPEIIQDYKTTDPSDQYFNGAILDHFRPDGNINWNQRYLVNDTWWGGNGFPIFLMIGGEGPISPRDVNGGLYMAELAKEHQALQVTLEHRFYGKSFPTANMSTDNLKYLHSEQALADLVVFHEYFTNLKAAPNSPWVAFGGSYPGCLTAWFRLKFPHIAIGAIASSAPVNTVVDFFAYMDVVESSLNREGLGCTKSITNSVNVIEQYLQTTEGRFKLKSLFNLCYDIVTDYDVATFQAQLMGNVQGVAQYSGDGAPVPRPNVEELCNIVAQNSDPIQLMVALQNQYGGNPPGECLDTSYAGSLAAITNTTFDWTQNGRQWTFQTCNQFGMFQTTAGINSFSGFKELNLAYYEKLCSDAFSINRSPYFGFSNNYYGATNIQATNVYFPNGDIDPWHALGVINSTTLYQPTESPVFINGTAHCGDMYAVESTDLPTLVFARTRIASIVSTWLNDFYNRN